MTKNIQVIDETGKSYGTTYEKRAKGLVKNGRARFSGADTICLTRPPSNQEDTLMNESINNGNINDMNIEHNNEISNDRSNGIKKISPTDRPLEYTMESILSRIDMILNDTAYISQAIDVLGEFKGNESPMGGEGDSSRAKALGAVVAAREETNRKILGMLESMYEDLKPRKPGLRERAMEMVEKTMNNTGLTTDDRELLSDMISNIRNLE